MAETTDWVGPIIGLGIGLVGLNMLSRATGGGNVFGSNRSRASGYSVYVGNSFHRRYRNFQDARREADRLRNKGVAGVTVFSE